MQPSATADLNGSAMRSRYANGTAAHTAATMPRVGQNGYPPNHYPSQPAKPHRGDTAQMWASHKMNNNQRKIDGNDLYN
ncbi:MAG: hypothetical protein VZR73_19125 [Acutalibacteraceae bacterium]|nr:hypothetical protein [Acutalibacteraceae bacterium]